MTGMDTRTLVFASNLGWIGVQHVDAVLSRITMGHTSKREAVNAVSPAGVNLVAAVGFELRWIEMFNEYLAGQEVDLSGFEIDTSWMTAFQTRVVDACRQIPRGETLSYGQVAVLAGSPGASRAVGSVMAKNRFPLVVPCHRVVGANGLGGFSAPNGLRLKERLLRLEGALNRESELVVV